MRFHFIEHARHEGPGALLDWIVKHACDVTCSRPYKGEMLPSSLDFDCLIILGGPQTPLQPSKFPYLSDEISFTGQAIQMKKKVFGVCLGAQIISEALDGETMRSPMQEYGVYPVSLSKEVRLHSFFKDFPESVNAFHWHNDMPAIPTGAISIGSSAGCPNQGFIYDNNTVGFQFHLELTPSSLSSLLVAEKPNGKRNGKFVSNIDELRNASLGQMNELLYQFLTRFLKT